MSQRTVCLDTELRKLRPAELYTLGQILNISDSWKKLMAIVPKEGNPNLSKFNAEHFCMIEQAAQQQRRNAAEIFLVEWGTMGKKRPTLHTLLNLLVKAELFRAADYVAGDILKDELPKRPECGPAAPIDISDDVIKQLLQENTELQNTNFNESLVFGLPTGINNDHAMNSNAMKDIMNNSSLERNMQSTKLISVKEGYEKRYLEDVKNVDIQQKYLKTSNIEVSDLMKFSSDNNMEECKTQDNLCYINMPNTKNNNLHSHIFEKREMLSNELPIFLNEFRPNPEQTTVKQELTSDYLPVFLNNNRDESSTTSYNDRTNDSLNLSNINMNQNEITSFELPQCIVELAAHSTTNRDDTIKENVLQNSLKSQELPVTVLEYNK
ncbi:interleukin 1 receptor associated kinase 4 tube isoform X2 [Calliopsis andreniformis]|uniref:interleukin 1 receptor associated kinase 4 tube isoform X2 n=1 Tax=Calliopsis andreniformis TaxID=337506 RepID=UPI003FCE9B1F